MAKRFKDVPNVPFAPVAAVLFALVVTALMFATPAWRLERLVTLTGLSDMLSAARPPLGDTARTLMAITSGLFTFIFLWAVLRPIEKLIHNRGKGPLTRSYTFGPKPEADAIPVVANTHSPARKPIFAAGDLGAPLMSDAALSSGGELFLDAAMIDAPLPASDSNPVEAELLHDDLPVDEIQQMSPMVADVPEPVITETEGAAFEPAPQETVIEWLSSEQAAVADNMPIDVAEPLVEPFVAPAPPVVHTSSATSEPSLAEPVSANMPEPTLRELLVKFEAALKRREATAGQDRGQSAQMPETTAQSLRDLMAHGRLR
jgi:hypothetical protein